MSSKLKWSYQPFNEADKKAPSIACSCLELHKCDSLVANQATKAVTPQHWPTEPEPLAADPRYDTLMNVYDAFLSAIPLFLIAKTSSCIYAHQLDKNHRGNTIDQVSSLTTFLLSFNDQLVTAFTIVFVTIMTTLVRRLALYKAQEGATVSDLEQLQASISLPSTIKMVFSLRKFTRFSAILVAVWSFYYLGSQASKREYGYASSGPYHQIRAVYPTNDVGIYVQWNTSDAERLNQQLRDYVSYRGSKNSIPGVDETGYVLVPSLNPSSHFGAIEGSQWIDIQPSQVNYSAFAGRPLSIEPQMANQTGQYWEDERIMGDYIFNTTYMDVRCGSLEMHPESAFPANVTPGMWTSINKTSSISSSPPVVLIDVWNRWNESYTKYPSDDQTFAINGSSSGSVKVTCNITNPTVTLKVHCSELACLVKAMQYNPPNGTEQPIHPLADDDFAALFFSNLLLSYGPPNGPWVTASGTPIEQDIGNYLSILAMTEGISNLTSSVQEQSIELTQYINSYYNLGLSTFPGASGIYHPGPDTGYGFVSVRGSLYDPSYVLSWPWVSIDYFSAGILFAAAMFSFGLRRRTLAPDIFGYVSSLTRDNPHLMIPDGGSTWSGIDRARHLQDVKIRISDVRGQHGDIGKVGVTIVQDSEGFGPLRKERKYL